MVQFGEFLKTWSLRSNSVTSWSILIRQKLVENAKIDKLKCDLLGDFQTLCTFVIMDIFGLKMSDFGVFSNNCHDEEGGIQEV